MKKRPEDIMIGSSVVFKSIDSATRSAMILAVWLVTELNTYTSTCLATERATPLEMSIAIRRMMGDA